MNPSNCYDKAHEVRTQCIPSAIDPNNMQATSPTYPACFAGMDLDTINYHLRQGYATKADAAQMVRWWNEGGKRFTTATLREHAVVINRCECIALYISISD